MARMSEISRLLGVNFGGEDVEIERLGAVESADNGTLVFATDVEGLEEALRSSAGGILASGDRRGRRACGRGEGSANRVCASVRAVV